MKVERVSYDVITPSAARGLLEAIYWKPGMRWVITRIRVLQPIRFQTFRRNEVATKVSSTLIDQAMRQANPAALPVAADAIRQQRATTLLTHVGYIIAAHCTIVSGGQSGPEVAKHLAMFSRRAGSGQCFHQPYFGMRECPAHFRLLTEGEDEPMSHLPEDQRHRDLGWMLHDLDYANGATARFFRARLSDGMLDVVACLQAGLAS